MKRRGLFVIATLATVLGLLVGACAPAAAPASPTATPAPTKPAPAPTPNQAPSPTLAPERPAPTPSPVQRTAPTSPPKAPLAAESPKYGGVLNLVLREDPPHLDMHLDSIGSMLMALSPNYSLLVQFDPKEPEKVVPDLAERWEISPDGKVYTFYLRKGVRFHDGTPVTAKDVSFTFNNIVFPPKGVRSKHQAFFTALEKVEAVDDYTVRMTTKFPQASFISMVAIPFAFIYSNPYYQAKGDMRKNVMGSGPFKFKNYARGVSFEVERNSDY
ncbi:MAG: ABC transporter substrate-binding protein, partial [Chloroflexota bacterium]|nr:ABC transporter substrate-binding protein [Chloroflexota bacterium]